MLFSLVPVGQPFRCYVHLSLSPSTLLYKKSNYIILKKVKRFYCKNRPSKGKSGAHGIHDKASSHKCEGVRAFSASVKVHVRHLPYSSDLSLFDFYFEAFRKYFKEELRV